MSNSSDNVTTVTDDFNNNYSAQVFPGLQGEAFISLIEGGKHKTMPLRSSQWDGWLNRYIRQNNINISPYYRDEITASLCASALSSNKQEVCVRVARDKDSIQIDLNDDSFNVIRIEDGKKGFQVRQPNGAFFFRPSKQEPLPKPLSQKLSEFKEDFCRLIPDLASGHWILILAFILKSLNRDRGSFAILVIEGPQGSGKTTFSRRVKSLIDPCDPCLMSPPKISDDLIVGSRNSYLLAFDNMSGISSEMADNFCRLSTGGGIAKRKLYTDHEEVYYKLHRPVLINGIDEPSNRPDFLDRCITIELNPISSDTRRLETELDKEFMAKLPFLLGGLYSLLSECLQILPTIQSANLPRLSDYAIMGIAIEKVLKLPSGYFIKIFEKNRNDQTENAFWNDDLCTAIFEKLEKSNGRIEGTANELKNIIFGRTSVNAPRTAKGFSSWLKRAEPTLKAKGIIVERLPRTALKRTLIIRSLTPIPPKKCRIHRTGNGRRS